MAEMVARPLLMLNRTEFTLFRILALICSNLVSQCLNDGSFLSRDFFPSKLSQTRRRPLSLPLSPLDLARCSDGHYGARDEPSGAQYLLPTRPRTYVHCFPFSPSSDDFFFPPRLLPVVVAFLLIYV